MLTIILLTLFLGIIWGGLLFAVLFLHLIKVKCPQCKQLKPLKEIILFNLKQKTISGQPCLKCQQTKPKVNIF